MMFSNFRPNLRSLNVKILQRKQSSGAGTPNNFWQWTTTNRPTWKESKTEAVVAFAVFGITGSLSVLAVRPTLKSVFGIEGTLVDGPNSYRLMSILLVSPAYATILLAVGTISGRHNYFARMSMKILGRFFPKTVIHKIVCKPGQAKLPTK